MDFSDNFLRGITDKNLIDDQGNASGSIFKFDKNERTDGYEEASINWYDDEGAVVQLKTKKKENGEIQYKHGLAVVDRAAVDQVIRIYEIDCKYERDKLVDNPYHGNLLKSATLSKNKARSYCEALALAINRII